MGEVVEMAIIPVHSMREQPDYLGTLQRGMAFGSQMRQQREAEQRRNRLAELGSQAYGAQGQARQDLIGQAVGVDMGQGLALGEALRQNDQAQMSAEDAQAKRLRGAAKYMMQAIETNDPNKIAGAHNAVRNFMGQFGQPFPEQFSPDMVPKIQEVLARTAYLEQGAEGTAVQSRFIDDQGNMVALMRDGSTRIVGKADPSMQIIEGEGGFYGVNRRNLNAAPVQLGSVAQATAQPMPTQDTMEADIAMANEMIRAGIPEAQVTAFLEGRAARANQQTAGLQAMPQPRQGGQLQAPQKQGKTFVQMSSDEIAAAGLPAGTTAQRDMETGQISIINKPAQPASEKAPTEGERKAATLLQRLNFSLGQLQEAVKQSPDAASPMVAPEILRRLPLVGDAAANAATPAERQRVESAQLDILDAALTLGTGAAYTREQLEGYRRSYFPQIGDSPASIRDKAARLQNVIEAAKIAAGRAAPNEAPAQQSQPPRRLKFNPQTGRIE